MIIQNLIIYQFTSFYKILKEIEKELNFKITETLNYKTLKIATSELDNYVIISKKDNSKIISPLIIEKFS